MGSHSVVRQIHFAITRNEYRDGTVAGDQDRVGLHIRADHRQGSLHQAVVLCEDSAGNGPNCGAIPHTFTDVPDHTVADHGRDAFVALAVDLTIRQNGGKAAIGPFDDLNRITALGQKGIIDF